MANGTTRFIQTTNIICKCYFFTKPYDEQLHAAEKAQTSYSEFVAGLLRAQWHERQDSALEWRIRRANLPQRWLLESFPWPRQPGVSRKQIRGFAELDFVAKHENLVFTGKTGTGKTGLACGLPLKALQNGYRCQFIRAQDLFDEMYASLADCSTRQLLNRLARLGDWWIESKASAVLEVASAVVPRTSITTCSTRHIRSLRRSPGIHRRYFTLIHACFGRGSTRRAWACSSWSR